MPNIVHESTSLASIIVLVATGLASAVIPRSLTAINILGVCFVPFDTSDASVRICIATNLQQDNLLAQKIHAILREKRRTNIVSSRVVTTPV